MRLNSIRLLSMAKRKEREYNIFNEWLVGFTDGDGCFSICKCGNTYRLQYSLSQSYYNIRILYYIKSNLGYGGVSKYEKNKVAHFRISDRKVLASQIFPIFDKFPLRTSKYFNYLRFKKAHQILENSQLTIEEKNNLINLLLKEKLPTNYISPVISDLDPINSSYEQIKPIITDNWLTGFVEAEGYFGVIPDRKYFNIEFILSQKLDKNLLELMRRVLHISAKLTYSEKRDIYQIKTKNSRAVNNIIELMSGRLKGMKSLEFKLWSQAFYYRKTNLTKVEQIYKIIQKLRLKS